MESKNTAWVWIGIVVIILVIVGVFYFSGSNNSGSSAQNGTGKVYVTVSDASANVQGVSDVDMTVNDVELHSASQGWVTVSNSPNTFNLLTLKANGHVQLAGQADVPAGTYDQVRATISGVEVVTNSGNKPAILASNTLTITGPVIVAADASSEANLDVHTSDSLHVATDGEYVFTPVVNFESRDSANVTVNSDNSVTVSGGTVDTNVIVGTDLSGATHVGAELSSTAQIQINAGAPVLVGASASGSSSELIQVQPDQIVGGSGSASATTSTSAQGSTNPPVQVQGSGSGSGSVNVGY